MINSLNFGLKRNKRKSMISKIGVIVSSNLVECVRKADETSERNAEDLIKEAVNLLVRSR